MELAHGLGPGHVGPAMNNPNHPAKYPAKPTRRQLAKLAQAKAQGAPTGRVWGYVRVSTDVQVDEGESLEVQQRQLEGYAQMIGAGLAHVYVEAGVTGSKPLSERPQGAAMIAALAPGDTVITPKLDRMFRSAFDALGVMEAMKAAGISLHAIDLGGDVTGNGVSKLVFTILAGVAEWERERTRERITDVKRDQRQRGRYLGGTAPFGWSVGPDKVLVADEAQQAVIARIRARAAEGAGPYDISGELREDGIKLSHVTVRKIMHAAGGAAA